MFSLFLMRAFGDIFCLFWGVFGGAASAEGGGGGMESSRDVLRSAL
jgi:hypothetical protein